MKQIQIPEQLFMELVKFHLLDMEENLPSIKQGLEAKLDALVMRDLYSKYKTAPTEEEFSDMNDLGSLFQPNPLFISSNIRSLPPRLFGLKF